jgi:hypothetical protein
MSEPAGSICGWCSRAFMPRTTGGKPQVFCREACRRGFDAAGRRWVYEAIARGMLTIDALRKGAAATRARETRLCSATGAPRRGCRAAR